MRQLLSLLAPFFGLAGLAGCAQDQAPAERLGQARDWLERAYSGLQSARVERSWANDAMLCGTLRLPASTIRERSTGLMATYPEGAEVRFVHRLAGSAESGEIDLPDEAAAVSGFTQAGLRDANRLFDAIWSSACESGT
jgi:hypothetical protein